MPNVTRVNGPTTCQHPKNSRGWTLAELLIVVALMGLLGALALPT
jgi:prepilin-type N-terminal cleavage/methylation domain-containing protein